MTQEAHEAPRRGPPRDFSLLLAGQTVSLVGSGVMVVVRADRNGASRPEPEPSALKCAVAALLAPRTAGGEFGQRAPLAPLLRK